VDLYIYMINSTAVITTLIAENYFIYNFDNALPDRAQGKRRRSG
jgi:hypothetical protein